jgi:hypothetical protein
MSHLGEQVYKATGASSLLLQLKNTMALITIALSTGNTIPATIQASIGDAPALPHSNQAGNAFSRQEKVARWKALYGKPVAGSNAVEARQIELYFEYLDTKQGTKLLLRG